MKNVINLSGQEVVSVYGGVEAGAGAATAAAGTTTTVFGGGSISLGFVLYCMSKYKIFGDEDKKFGDAKSCQLVYDSFKEAFCVRPDCKTKTEDHRVIPDGEQQKKVKS